MKLKFRMRQRIVTGIVVITEDDLKLMNSAFARAGRLERDDVTLLDLDLRQQLARRGIEPVQADLPFAA